mmetsp:Transcript_20779/g.49137  ORF Transcript_20779/g.49137 Transcript_20779/m.49137 type:complete len:114 (-) Transcript_20779:426-767(-)|eukprot:CAMPEP_0197189086 /NCGR_PEP_ID=MMETSP1423-20130617/19141_1 /TAXON_ID=476441 /ORGANISM="Pseudo-nitzschia heimii, Strain UNC1101" /LENGTH=113 /DNA_ID=CAMNT_0042641113 /DNA_START=95 /DNA_END=436 /DNA_ORIENTATION=+
MSDSIASAVSFARRNTDDSSEIRVSEGYCSALLLRKHLPAGFEIPSDCSKFESFRSGLNRRDSKDREEAVAFAGMDPGAAIQAKASRERGRPSQAQLIRRMSSRKGAKESSWF